MMTQTHTIDAKTIADSLRKSCAWHEQQAVRKNMEGDMVAAAAYRKEAKLLVDSAIALDMLSGAALERVTQLTNQIGELQSRMTEMVNGQLSRQVRAFMKKFGQHVATSPAVPPDDVVRFRLKLDFEELFEKANACVSQSSASAEGLTFIAVGVAQLIDRMPIKVDMESFVDACADLAYTNEGSAAAFGVHMRPIQDAVHAANMAKDAVLVEAKDAYHIGASVIKPKKPEGWQPPAIGHLLVEQGWEPHPS